MAGEVDEIVLGERVLGRFTLLERLGAGGFGTVYSAWDERLQRHVAVKAIEVRGEAGRRVMREAQAAARLNHRGIVTLYELGEDDRHAYLVSELAHGETLDELAREGRISDREVALIGAELCDALEHAHAHGVVHRDIKPQNVVVRPADEPLPPGSARAKLMDFGIAHLHDAPRLTRTGEIVGTIAYMAPEQAEGDAATSAADVYSLALALYECWSGDNPVVRATPAATARAIGEPVPPLRELRPELPVELCDTLDACLVPESDERPAVAELAGELEAAVPRLDGRSAVPAMRRARSAPEARAQLARVAALSGLAGMLTWLGLVAGRPGAALVAAALLAPIPLLLTRPLHWGLPALAPLLGVVGLAPLYPALAALAPTCGRRFALGVLGWAWLAVAESVLDKTLLFATIAPAPAGWAASASLAAHDVLAPLLAPASLLAAIVWALAAAVLGYLLRGRMIALELLGVLLWAAGLVAVHRLLAGGAEAPAAAPLAAGAVALAVLVLWLRLTGGPVQASRAPGGLA
jgi:eukaryotic-like serine/threonine-protein kinase